jgi:hypothetical protein
LLFSLGFGDDEEDWYLYRYSKEEWRDKLRERSVVNVALFSGCEDVSPSACPSLPPSSLALLSVLTCSEEGEPAASVAALMEASEHRAHLLEETITSTFAYDRSQKRGWRYFNISYVPQSLASEWIERHIHECDLALFVLSAVARDGAKGARSLEYLVDRAEQIKARDAGTTGMFVCADIEAPVASAVTAQPVDEIRDTDTSSQDAQLPPFQAAVDYVKTTSLPQVEKINALQLGRAMDPAAFKAFCGSLEDALAKRSADRGGVLSLTSWIMSWASSLWKLISFFLPAKFRFFGLVITS